MKRFGVFIALLLALTSGVSAQEDTPVKIGFIGTLSGNLNAPGMDILDGFQLALDHLDNMMGGRPVELIVRDDTLTPDLAITQATELIETEQVDFITGTVYSNILLAIAPQVFEAQTFLISASAGPSQLAGAACSPFFFNMSYQNDSMNEAMGQSMNALGYENVIALAPDYSAGRDALVGFRRFYTGQVTNEIYSLLGDTDFSAEIALIRATMPDAVYTFQPAAAAVAFINQYSESGLMEEVPLFLPGVSADADTIRATGDASEGLFNASHWVIDLDNETNARFVADYRAKYDRVPSIFSSQGYDSALLIASAVAAVGGDLSDKAAVQAALEAADFAPTRGTITFNNNHFPIQNVYLRQVTRQADGSLINNTVATIFEGHLDAYHTSCALP